MPFQPRYLSMRMVFVSGPNNDMSAAVCDGRDGVEGERARASAVNAEYQRYCLEIKSPAVFLGEVNPRDCINCPLLTLSAGISSRGDADSRGRAQLHL
jgi:hypothetical protein